MKRTHSLVVIFVLVIAPMFPVFMVPTTNTDSNPITHLDDILEELVDMGGLITSPEEDVELNMMIFTETPSSKDGLYYVCKQGMDVVAYFGASIVKYLSGSTVFTLEFPGSRSVVPQGEHRTGSVTNYLLGNDPSLWKIGIEDCAVVRYPDIYPEIDLVYKIQDGNLKYEFVVAPDADPGLIKLKYEDVDSIEIIDDGFIVTREGQQMTDTQLRVLQKNGDIEVGCTFSFDDNNNIIFNLDMYDDSEELVIDPILLGYSTFIGESFSDSAYGIAVENGFAYITGETWCSDFPTFNANDSTYNGGSDCFVTKLAADGQSIIYSTFLGGSSDDCGKGIVLESGFAYVIGYTYSSNFPTTIDALNQTFNGGNTDCFVTKLATDGQSLIYSTFLGGEDDDFGNGIAVESGNAYITGETLSGDFPTTTNAFDESQNGGADVFVTKFAADGQSLVYSTYIGSTEDEIGNGIAVESGNAYITGYTLSTGYPTEHAY
ncbi:MAG: DUF7948 domain-containing protein, partial [Candidatus Thorarchaeota archaeon]